MIPSSSPAASPPPPPSAAAGLESRRRRLRQGRWRWRRVHRHRVGRVRKVAQRGAAAHEDNGCRRDDDADGGVVDHRYPPGNPIGCQVSTQGPGGDETWSSSPMVKQARFTRNKSSERIQVQSPEVIPSASLVIRQK